MKVLITGITGRVGANVAVKFLENGHEVRGFVWPGDRQAEKMKAVGAEIVEGDLASSADVNAAAEDQEAILHLGAAFQAGGPFTPEQYMDTNVKGVFFITQKLLPLLRAAGTDEDPARVINIGSIDGLKNPVFQVFSYGPSKAALHHLTRGLALHLAKENIVVNAIAPGPFPTWMLSTGVGGGGDTDIDWSGIAERNPRKRVGTPEDIAGVTIFLASRAGAYTVGEVISCDGGSTYAT